MDFSKKYTEALKSLRELAKTDVTRALKNSVGMDMPYDFSYQRKHGSNADISYRKDEVRHILDLFIDQDSAKIVTNKTYPYDPDGETPLHPPAGFKEQALQRKEQLEKSPTKYISGLQIRYEVSANNDGSIKTKHFTLYLEPAGDAEKLKNFLEEKEGLSGMLFSHALAMPSRKDRMYRRGVALSDVSNDKREIEKKAALVMPFSSEKDEPGQNDPAILDLLYAKDIITKKSLDAAKAGMRALDTTASGKKFPERTLKQDLKGLEGPSSPAH